SPRCPRGAGHAHGVPRLAQAGIHLDAAGWHRPCAAFTSGSLAQLAHPAPRRTVPGEGPCVDACRQDRVVAEPDLADPVTRRWLAFTRPALRAGARAVFGFPLRVGTVRLGALNLYRDRPGPLSGEQH